MTPHPLNLGFESESAYIAVEVHISILDIKEIPKQVFKSQRTGVEGMDV